MCAQSSYDPVNVWRRIRQSKSTLALHSNQTSARFRVNNRIRTPGRLPLSSSVIGKWAAARDEFVSEYSVPMSITQYQGLLLSTKDYPDFYFLLD